MRVRSVGALALGLALLASACTSFGPGDGAPRTAIAQPEATLVFVSGVTGTKLVDPESGALAWGTSAQLLRPRDRGYSLALPLASAEGEEPSRAAHRQARYEPVGPILEMRLFGWRKKIYGPLIERLEREGYRLGRLTEPGAGGDLFFFDYDWRRSTLDAALSLGRQLGALAARRGGDLEIDLVCQSNASKICRYLVKYGSLSLDEAESGQAPPPAEFRIRKLVLIGASNGGAMRALALLDRGRRYVPLLGRKISIEVLFTLRALFDDLPSYREDLFVDGEGRPLAVDLFRPQAWVDYGWSVFDPEVESRVERAGREDLFGSRDERLAYLTAQLRRARRFQALLLRDVPSFPPVRYYRLENRSQSTMDRAVLDRVGGGWRTGFAIDGRIGRNPRLAALVAAPGDEHATLSSQRDLSPQEEAAFAGAAMIAGGHFEMVIERRGLDALVSFLR